MFFIQMLAVPHFIHVRVDILLAYGKLLHDHIISLRGEAHRTSLPLPHFIEVPIPSQESEQSCICGLGVSIFPLSMIFIFAFGIILTV